MASARGLRRSGVERSDVFLETKVWISDYGYDATLHQPLPSRFDLTTEAYRALETLLADGRVRAIGVGQLHARAPSSSSCPWSPIGGITFYREGYAGMHARRPRRSRASPTNMAGRPLR